MDPDDAHDKGEDFSLEDLFTSAAFDVVTDLPKISKSDYSVEDFDELQHYRLTHKDEEEVIVIRHQGEWLTFVPTKLRRSFFWACHFPRHEGVTYMVDKIKQLGCRIEFWNS